MASAPPELPVQVAELVEALHRGRGVEAVVLGGSRAAGTADPGSDWDLGVYYSGVPDLAAVEALGQLHRAGEWGRIMNGGAWLELDGTKVDVLLRDVGVVRHWCDAARV